MKKLDKPVWPQLFCGTISLCIMDAILLFTYAIGLGEIEESFYFVGAIGTIIGLVVAFILESKLNLKPYDKNDNYDKYFYLPLAAATIVLFCCIFLYGEWNSIG